jgi:hypothetical protein
MPLPWSRLVVELGPRLAPPQGETKEEYLRRVEECLG